MLIMLLLGRVSGGPDHPLTTLAVLGGGTNVPIGTADGGLVALAPVLGVLINPNTYIHPELWQQACSRIQYSRPPSSDPELH